VTTPKQILNSHSRSAAPPSGRDHGPYSAHYAVKGDYSGWILLLIILVVLGAVALVFAQNAEAKGKPKPQYQLSTLPSLDGTNSGGNSINDLTWVAGYSRMLNRDRHAILWRDSTLTDLGTLGGPNSSVTWNVKNTSGIIVGISQTSTPEPLGENWSSAIFYSSPNNVGYINLGFVWKNNQMRGLPPFAGGNNSFATGANNLGQVVGWAENGIHDPTCCCQSDPGHQVLQFRPAVWDLGPPDKIHDLPLIPGDTSGTATAINDNGQIVGISGICDQAVGRRSAKHAVLWENGTVTDIYPGAPAPWWNTPTAINQHGDVAGFVGVPSDVDGNILQAFIWTKDNGLKVLKPLRGHVPQHVHSEAYGINEADQVVGVSCDADQNDCRAVIWDHGVYPTDLNDPDVKGSYSGFLTIAKDINNKGEITGRGVDPATGSLIAYLAVPADNN
jgi:probable HAF family extracellular repeat protein